MNQYAVFTACKRCTKKEKWYLNSEETDWDMIANEIYENMQIIYNSGFHCPNCKTVDAVILSVTEVVQNQASDEF